MKTVIFDVDGTLVDSVALHARCWQEVFRRYGKRVSQADISAQVGKGGDLLLPVFFSTQEIRRFGKRMRKERDLEFQKKYLRRVRPFPKVKMLMQRLKDDGFQVLLGSSGKKADILFYIQLLGIGKLLDGFTTSEDAKLSKPHPDIFLAALRKSGNPAPTSVLVVGDSPYDAQAAKRAHIKSVGVLCGGFSRHVLLRAGCSQVFRDPADLLRRYAYSPWPWSLK